MSQQLKKASSHDVYISYSVRDRVIADALCRYLEENNIRCWFAPRDILSGQVYAEVIRRAISEAKIFVIVCSHNSLDSEFVQKETAFAVSEGKIIVPCRIEDYPLTGAMRTYLNDVRWIDAFPQPEQHFDFLAETVSGFLENTSSSSPEKP